MGLFSFLDKNKQAIDEEDNPPVKARRSRRTESSEAQEPLDPALPEKRRARRRLIGATALVLAAIIGLPMIFDSEPKPFSDEIAIKIPARDAPATRQSAPSLPPLELSPPVVEKPSAPVAPVAPIKSEAPTTVAKTSLPEPVQAEKEVKKEVAPKESSKENIKEITKEKANDKASDKSKDKSKDKANDKSNSKSSNKNESAKQSDNKNAKSNRDLPIRYVLQIAAVESKAKADEMQEKLKKAGIKSYSQKISTSAGDRIRIRVGPFVNKEEAEKMRARLRKLGLSGSLQPV
jgi:DedD protein